MEQGQRRTGDSVLFRTVKIAVVLSLSLCGLCGFAVAQSDARLSGVVRDTHGTPQMGVTVELFGPVVATALTDLQGRYQIKDVLPGIYQLRASATLYVPSLQRHLRLAAGHRSIVNLTMTGLLDEAAWMASSHPDAAGELDDWKWTLRSPANRPLLRLAQEAGGRSREEEGQRIETHAAVSFAQKRGGFGASGDCGRFSVAQRTENQTRMRSLRASSCRSAESSAAASLSLASVLETGESAVGKRRFSGRVRTFPQIHDTSGASFEEIEFASGERLQLGDLLALEAGSETQLLRAGSSLVVSHPFFRVEAHTGRGWVASYSFATAVGMSQYDDLGSGDAPAPTVIRTQRGLLSESGAHHELAARHSLKRGRIEIVYHRDTSPRAGVSGLFLGQATAALTGPDKPQTEAGSEFTIDTSNGSFRTFGPGYTADGGGLILSYPVTDELEVVAGYQTSTGVVLRPIASGNSGDGFGTDRSEALFAAVNAKMKRTGTQLAASYRWQPARMISVVAPYDMARTSPYLSVHLRQSLPASRLLPPGTALTVDGDNILREGYEGATVAKQQALLASALQDLRAGITFTF